MKHLHQAQVTALGGRLGIVASSDRQLRLHLSTGAAGEQGTNPEQLFAAAFAASFLSAIKAAAEREHVPILCDSNVTVAVSLAAIDPEAPDRLTIRIDADLPGVAADTAERLVARARELCPYAAAIRDSSDLRISVG